MKTLCLLSILFLSWATHATNPVMRVDSIQADPQSEINVPLYVDFSSVQGGVGSMTIFIEFDTDVLSFQGYENLDTLVVDPLNIVVIQESFLLIAWYTVTDPLQLSGKLLDLQFQYHGGTSDLVFEVDRCLLSDDAAMPVFEVDYQNGNISEIDYTNTQNMNTIHTVIYPNPATNLVVINTTYPLERVEVFDATGQVHITTQKDNVDVSVLVPGVYFIRVLSNQNVSIHKFLKSNY